MIEVKLTLQTKEQVEPATEYLQTVFTDLHTSAIELSSIDQEVRAIIYKQEGRAFIDRVLEDYSTCGFEIDGDFNLLDIALYTTDPELNHYFLCQRANINSYQTDAALEAIAEIANDAMNNEKALEKIDAILAVTGSYRTRAIVDKIVQGLANNDIFIGEDVDQVLPRSIH